MGVTSDCWEPDARKWHVRIGEGPMLSNLRNVLAISPRRTGERADTRALRFKPFRFGLRNSVTRPARDSVTRTTGPLAPELSISDGVYYGPEAKIWMNGAMSPKLTIPSSLTSASH